MAAAQLSHGRPGRALQLHRAHVLHLNPDLNDLRHYIKKNVNTYSIDLNRRKYMDVYV